MTPAIVVAVSVVVAAVFAVASVVISRVHQRFVARYDIYAVPAGPEPSEATLTPLLRELKSLVFIVPAAAAVALLLPDSAQGPNTYAVHVSLLSFGIYFLYVVAVEYQDLYNRARRSYETGIPSVPALYFLGVVALALMCLLSAFTAFVLDTVLALTLFLIVLGIAVAYALWNLASLIIPMERDMKLIETQKENSPILGEGLAQVDDIVFGNPHGSPTQLRHVSTLVASDFVDSLPGTEAERKRVLEFAVNCSLDRRPLRVACCKETCRRAVVGSHRLSGCFDGEEVLIDVGAVRGKMVACNILSSHDGKRAVTQRYVAVSRFTMLKLTGEASLIRLTPTEFLEEATRNENDLRGTVDVGAENDTD